MRLFMVLELCRGGSLANAICGPTGTTPEDKAHVVEGESIGLSQKFAWAVQCADALAYLHSRSPPIIHRDLKPQNVLITDGRERSVKLADFGTSRSVSPADAHSLTTKLGTIAYMPPECLLSFGLVHASHQNNIAETVVGEAWDVYSLAILFAFIFTERHPYPGLRDGEIIHEVVEDGLRPAMHGMQDNVGFMSLIGRMWDQESEKRPSASEVADSCLRLQQL